MNQQNSGVDTPSSNDDIEIEEAVRTIDPTTTSQNLVSSSTIFKTARDQFFEDLQTEVDRNSWSAKCLLCTKPKRVIEKQGVTSNFTRHVRHYHKEEYEKWLNESNKVNSPSQTNKITSHFSKKSCSPNRALYGSNHPRQMELSLAIVNDLIITMGLPLSIVERPAFINFMRKVDSKFNIVNRRTITRKTIPTLYDKMHDHLITFCSTATFLSLALDIWSDRRMRSFFAITAHAIIGGNFKTYVLCFVPLWGTHSGAVLLKKYEEIINKFDIKSKIVRLITDNAANNINAFQNIVIPGFEKYFIENDDDGIDEYANDSDTNDDEVLSDEYDYPPDQLSTTNLLATSDVASEDLIQESINRLMENTEIFRIPCFAHSLQLVVKDGLKEAKSIVCALEKVSAIAKLAHTSTKFAEKLDLLKVSIPRAVITRWNSQFMTVERILAIPTVELNDILGELKYKHLCLNTRDITMLQEFIDLFSLFAQATTATQSQNLPSISIVAPSILAIYLDLISEKNNVQYTTSLCESLLSSLLSRFGGLLEQLEINFTDINISFKTNNKFYNLYKDPIFLLSPFFDGMFKIRWITQSILGDSTKERLCGKIKQLVFDHCLLMIHESESLLCNDPKIKNKHQELPSVSLSSSNIHKRKNLFANIEHDLKNSKKAKPDDSYTYIQEEISRYINDDNNDSMILLNPTSSSSYKTLAKLATKYLCVPATSAGVERVFSQSGFLFRSHRARMSRKTLEQLTMLKCNNSIA
ncbi:unnamed protein product [Adineta steineri]|uniref:HAT C-terminal dimerisation domain-containing protein n=1 Tax=Adineta steineri TaxID=433720 RepID=A0A819SVC1_9BILA|nr:unnamed protein product [Adineta steineri]CAF4071162.1 unnamed protein product [Adineta steineri]